jgi:hypothetical protein
MAFDDEINKFLKESLKGLTDSTEEDEKSQNRNNKSHQKATKIKKNHAKSIAELVNESKKLNRINDAQNKRFDAQAEVINKLNARIKVLNARTGTLGVRNTRNAMTFSVLRSKILMFNFALAMTAGKVLDLIKAYGEQERAEKAVQQALISTGHAAGMSAEEINNMASTMQKATGIGDELILKSSSLLATFTQIGRETFPEAQQAILDATAAMYGGQLSGEALKTTTIQVGKALNDPIKGMNALSRVGVKFSHEQKKQIQFFVNTNQLAKAQAVIIKELGVEFGGMAEAIRNTTEGRLTALNASIGDLAERLGKDLTPEIDKLLESLITFTDSLDTDDLYRWVFAMTGAVAVTKTLTGFLALLNVKYLATAIATGSLVQSKRALTVATVKYTRAITMAGKASKIAATGGMFALGAILFTLFNSLLKTKKEAEKLANKFKEFSPDTHSLEQYDDELSRLNRLMTARAIQINELKVKEKELEDIENHKLTRGARRAKAEKERAETLELIKIKEEALMNTYNQFVKLESDRAIVLSATTQAQLDQGKKLEEMYNTKLEQIKRTAEFYQLEGDSLLFGVSTMKEMVKAANKLGLEYNSQEEAIKLLIEFYPELTSKIREFNEEQFRQKSELQAIEETQKSITTVFNNYSNDRIAKAKEEADSRMEHIKNTSAYKRAQARGDDAAMKKLENSANADYVKRRRKEFRLNQHMAAANITFDFLQAIAKEYGTKGILAAISSHPILLATLGAQLGAVYAQPMPKFAKGGDFITNGPQVIMVGDNPGGQERVQVTPLSSPNIEGPQGGGTVNINFSGNVLSQDFIEQEAIPQIKEAIRRGADIGVG